MHPTYAKARRYNRLPPEPVSNYGTYDVFGRTAEEIARPVHFTKACLHFVGFRGDEYTRAVRIFGKPDFIHRYWDHRAIGDIVADLDTVVFAKGTERDVPNVYAFNDSECF